MDLRILNRLGAVSGLVGVAGNVLGVAVLGNIPAAYRPGTLPQWVEQTAGDPIAAAWSAAAFVMGLLALAAWAASLGARLDSTGGRAAAITIAIGAVMNAVGCVAPLVFALHVLPVCAPAGNCATTGVALLGFSLALDALFNLLLGAGLAVLARILWLETALPRWVAWLTLVAGLASLPVGLQVVSDAAAGLLVVAGPLWLMAITVISIFMWRNRI